MYTVARVGCRPLRRWLSSAAEMKEKDLQAEAHGWNAPNVQNDIPFATPEEIPILDLKESNFVDRLRAACTRVGFHMITNHGIPDKTIQSGFQLSEQFHAQPHSTKMQYEMDKTPGFPGGVGYLPNNNFKLPKRVKGNQTETFIIKRENGPRNITLDKMPWPTELGSEWRTGIETYASAMEGLAMRMLPLYARALNMNADYFDSSFRDPLWRLRLGYYPKVESYEASQYGISPHVDTTFFTILAQREAGLVVFNTQKQCWQRVRHIPNTLVVNTGEILRNMTNDTWLSTRHYALNAASDTARYSIPFFFCPTADYPVEVVPSTITKDRPAKYPPTSYLDGQGVIQGE
eukprot:TRINITY_DN5598_c0_g1_i1.p1 TRINITY_DN5598_c0_g1~~TRINITY_DN5598_c0_g1_i1.p1  ORF type:complete len:362 (+),score=46.06 TRINITY_DN5598_c0_g1_i1:46-1086(+)